MARALILLSLIYTSLAGHARDLDKLYSKARFKIGVTEFTAYIADTDDRRAQGLMHIEKLPADTGMLFVFDVERPLTFWMKNTLIPLSIGFFDSRGLLVDALEMVPASSLMAQDVPTYQSRAAALMALEMPKGWFDRKKLKNGMRLQLLSKSDSSLLNAALKHAKGAGR